MKKLPNLILLLLMIVFMNGMDASAQLFIEEGKIKKVVTPGQALAESITVHNSTDQPIDIDVYLEDFEYVPPFDGTKKFYPAGTHSRSAAAWVNFEPRQFRLEPYARQKLNFTVNVPKDASGGYYSVLFFERKDIQQIQGQVGLQVISRVGSLFFIETGDRKKQLDLTDVVFEKNILHGTVKNIGNIYLVAQCHYYILDKDGIPVDRGMLDAYYLSPGNETQMTIRLADSLSAGRYTAVLTFDLEDGVSFVDEISFTVK